MRNYPISVIRYMIPIILVLAIFSIYSGSTLYFLISLLFLFSLLIIYYPFYKEAVEIHYERNAANFYEEESKHIEEKLQEALNGSAVAQRLIEDRIIKILIEDSSNRFNLDQGTVVEKILNNELKMDENIGNIFKKIYDRRYDMNYVVDKDTFQNEIKMVLDYVGV